MLKNLVTRDNIAVVFAAAALIVSWLSFRMSRANARRNALIEYAQRKQEVRLEMVRGQLLSGEFTSKIRQALQQNPHPALRAGLTELLKLTTENDKLIHNALAELDSLSPTPDLNDRIDLEMMGGNARVITEQGNAIVTMFAKLDKTSQPRAAPDRPR